MHFATAEDKGTMNNVVVYYKDHVPVWLHIYEYDLQVSKFTVVVTDTPISFSASEFRPFFSSGF